MGKARNITGSSEYIKQVDRQTVERFAADRQNATGITTVIKPVVNPTSAIESKDPREKVNRQGDVFTGAMSFAYKRATISSGTITVDQTSTSNSNRLYVRGEGSVADDLVTINAPQFKDFTPLYISNETGFGDITVKNSGNIRTASGSDLVMTGQKIYCFYWDPISSLWREHNISGTTVSGDNLGNHIATTDINFSSFYGNNVKGLKFTGTETVLTNTWSITAINPRLIINAPSGKEVDLRVNGSSQFSVNELTAAFKNGVNYKVAFFSSGTLNMNDDNFMLVSSNTSGVVRFNLPSASGRAGQLFRFYKRQSGGSMLIDPAGSDTIDGNSSLVISTQFDTASIMSDGVDNWMRI